MRSLVAALVLFAACGSVTADGAAAGAAGAGGAAGDSTSASGGRASAAGSGGDGAAGATGGGSSGGRAGDQGGSGGTIATGGVGSMGGTGGAAAPRPCDGICTDPREISFTSSGFNSGTLNSSARCFETFSYFNTGGCGSLDRTLSINSVPQVCGQGSWSSVPAAINGGWCVLLAAGTDVTSFTLAVQ